MRAATLNFILCLTLVLSACQHSSEPGIEAVAEVKAVQAARLQAMINVDVAVLESILSPDLVYTHTTGSVDTREQFIASLVQRNIRYHAVDVVENTIRVAGDVATSTGMAVMNVSNATMSLELRIRFIEVYMRSDGRWQLIAWQSTRLPPT